MKFFFDRNTSLHIARMLNHFDRDNNIVHQDDDGRFAPDEEDVTIITTLASEDPRPVWVTADLAQLRSPIERAALRDSGMTIFFRKRNNFTPHMQALKMLAIWPTVVEYAHTARVPTAFVIPGGKIGAKLNTKIDRLGNTSDLFKGG